MASRKAALKAWQTIAQKRQKPTPRQVAELLLRNVETMLAQAKELVGLIGTGQDVIFAEADEHNLKALGLLRKNTDDQYARIIGIMEKLRNKPVKRTRPKHDLPE
jgi:hypothetical protein